MNSSRRKRGGGRGKPIETPWSRVEAARTEDPGRRKEAEGSISAHYWMPVCAFLRWKFNLDEDQALDLTQDFFCQKVVERGLFRKGDRSRGSFWSFLCTCAWRFAASHINKPGNQVSSLDAMPTSQFPPSHVRSPEQAFAYGRASALLDEVIAAVEAGCREDGLGTHWEVFRMRVLEPILARKKPPSLSSVCQELGIEGPTKAAAMIVTVKNRFRKALRVRIRREVETDKQIDLEIRDLMDAVSGTDN